MNCPRCDSQMEQLVLSEVTVDICESGCGGIWFDQLEIKKFDEPHEEAGQELLNISTDSSIKIDQTKRLDCPKCEDTVMMRHFFSVKKDVEVDECPACAGFWIDVGELRQIRSLFPTEAARKEAAADYFHDIFGEQIDAMQAEREDKLAKAHQIANIFRFICPSYFIPGKQKWGAF